MWDLCTTRCACVAASGNHSRLRSGWSTHGGIRLRCSRCQRLALGYDCLPGRRWAPMGNPHVFLICAATGGVRRAWSCSGPYSSERRQTLGDLHHDGALSAVGTAAELAGKRRGPSDPVGRSCIDRWNGAAASGPTRSCCGCTGRSWCPVSKHHADLPAYLHKPLFSERQGYGT